MEQKSDYPRRAPRSGCDTLNRKDRERELARDGQLTMSWVILTF
jgi:hypothetical protein